MVGSHSNDDEDLVLPQEIHSELLSSGQDVEGRLVFLQLEKQGFLYTKKNDQHAGLEQETLYISTKLRSMTLKGGEPLEKRIALKSQLLVPVMYGLQHECALTRLNLTCYKPSHTSGNSFCGDLAKICNVHS